TNIPATLRSTGLLNTENWKLTEFGVRVANASSTVEAANIFVKSILVNQNGITLIDAISSLNVRGEKVTKASLKEELVSLGIEGLSTATTDHTTLRNWLVYAGVLGPQSDDFKPNSNALKALLGISVTERAELQSLPLPQQIFLSVFRRMVETEASDELPVSLVYSECSRDYKGNFDESQISSKVLQPLEAAGWLTLANRTGKSSGGKSGTVIAKAELLNIPMSEVLPNFDAVIPADLRAKRDTPRDEILKMLSSGSKNERGVGLELLALRMLIDLGLEPRSFRLRAKETAYAELDLTAEGAHLTFSRWNIQCKCITSKVSLGDIAKEVGLALYSHAHVVAVVTTSDFSREALSYCREITLRTHLQFLLIPGNVVQDYLQKGAAKLVEHAMNNAKEIMALKRSQPIDAEEE
ncbi:MAG: restriction endonuclease, partial [Paracoccaceae bacterium]|nr:restriction endonuclease [Paracoccaceae bacterium]